MESKETLVRANYRITSKQDKWVKKQAKKVGLGEAEFIRYMLQDHIKGLYNK